MSAVAGVTLLAPVEIMRLNMMVDRKLTLRAAFDALRGGWFRGNSADVLAAAPRVGITMAAFAMYKDLIEGSATVVSDWFDGPAYEPGSTWAVFLAGALAGATAQIATYPLDLVRTRLAVEGTRRSVVKCIVDITNEEGPRALYLGLGATIAGVLPFSSIKLATYDLLRR